MIVSLSDCKYWIKKRIERYSTLCLGDCCQAGAAAGALTSLPAAVKVGAQQRAAGVAQEDSVRVHHRDYLT